MSGWIYDYHLADVCRQIELHGLNCKEAEAAIIDATLVASTAQHSTSSISKPQQDTAECEAFNDLAVYFCADPDARWVKKGFKSTLYYIVFECIYEDGSTDHTHTASAN